MKAVILKIVDKKAIALKDDGTVGMIVNKNYSTGEEVHLKENKYPSRKWTSLVAALLIFAMVGTGTWVYATPNYEVSILGERKEIDEILFEVNRLGKVVNAKYAENSEYKELESREIFIGEDISDAMITVFECVDDEIDYRDLEITIISHSYDNAREEANMIYEKIMNHGYNDTKDDYEHASREKNGITSSGYNTEEKWIDAKRESIEIKHLCRHDKEEAETLGITPGKYNIIRNVMGNENVVEYVEELRGELGEDEDLSNKIMEKFIESRDKQDKEKVTGNNKETHEDKETIEEEDNLSVDAPEQSKEGQQTDGSDEKKGNVESEPKEESEIDKSKDKTDNSIDKISQGNNNSKKTDSIAQKNTKDSNQSDENSKGSSQRDKKSDKSSKNNNKDDENQNKPTKEKQANNNKKRA